MQNGTVKGTITVRDGVVVFVHAVGQDPAAVDGQTLAEALKAVEKEGWRIVGELPEFSVSGEYIIPIIKFMTLSVILKPQGSMSKLQADMQVSDSDLINREPLTGRFPNFNKSESYWQQLASAAEQGSTSVNVEGRGYKLTAVDADGNFRLEAA